MTQKIHQMQLAFVPLEDRLLFRVRTTDQNELRFWLTRRYVKLLWQVLRQMLGETQAGPAADPRAKEAMLSFQHEEALTKMDFATPYKEGSEVRRPLGDKPVLVSRIQVKAGPGNTRVLCMHPEQGQGVEIVLDSVWLHSLCKILVGAVKKSDWDLEIRIAEPGTPVSTLAH
ncbi:MAG: hypothetical protein JXL84_11090 [Deltaproteobacteria bacterium]|nr:hypothetical protein [Deltaproteobacteria bacterium]